MGMAPGRGQNRLARFGWHRLSAEANWSDCETKVVRGVAVVEDSQVPQGQQPQLLRAELEDGVGDGGLVVRLK